MKNNNGVVYETITVLAIHILNASEMPFEKDGTELLQRYQRFLLDCAKIMIQESKCMDFMIGNNCICSIYAGRGSSTIKRAMGAAVRIENLMERLNCKNTYDSLERIIMGIGIASGTAAMFKMNGNEKEKGKCVWIGPVMEKADDLSRAAIRNGERRIMAENKLYEIIRDIINRENI